MGTWGVASAKAQFSEVVAKALAESEQEITKGGKEAVTVISTKKLRELRQAANPKQSAADFWLNSPLRGSGIKLERMRGKFRKVDF